MSADNACVNLLRRVALGLSIVLVVALTVAFVARRGQLSHSRDVAIENAAALATERLNSVITSLEVAAEAGVDADTTLASVLRVESEFGVCAVDLEGSACGGTSPQPSAARIAERQDRRRTGLRDEMPSAVVHDRVIGVAVDGPKVTVLAELPDASLRAGSDADVWLTDSLPEQARLGEFMVDAGTRQYAVEVSQLPGRYVVTAAPDRVSLPAGEAVAFVVLGVLAGTLLLVAGFSALLHQRRLVERASVDQLTRLPNRSEFERRAGELITQGDRTGKGFAVLLFDLNGFKAVNDTYGHNAGDELLQIIGERLARGTRDGDIVARWGGDEFVVAMPGVVDDEMGARRAREIADLIGGRTRIDSARESVRVGAAVGVAFWPRHGGKLNRVLEAADLAMYQAKRQGLGVAVASGLRVPDTVPTELV